MKRRIMWINPIGISALDLPIKIFLDSLKKPETCINVVSLKKGPSHLNYHYYEAGVLLDTVNLVRQAEQEGYDAAIIGCFYDTGLHESREITDRLIVVAPGESSLHLAITLGRRVSVIVSKPKCIPKMKSNLLNHGFNENIVSFKSADLDVHEFRKNPSHTRDRLTDLAKRSMEEDMAEVIILGCTAQLGFFRDLQEEIGIPVIDAVAAPLKYAEFLVELKKRFGFSHSKMWAYKSPSREEMDLVCSLG